VIGPDGTYPLPLGPEAIPLPSGAELRVESEHVQLRVGRSSVILNDVEIHGQTLLRPGDVLTDGGVQYLVVSTSIEASPPTSSLLEHAAWMARVEEELTSGVEEFTILIGRSGAFASESFSSSLNELRATRSFRAVVGSFAAATIEVLVSGSPAAAESVRQSFSDVAGRIDETVRWGAGSYPRHGATPEELWSFAIDRFLGFEELESREFVWVDQSMARIRDMAERWSKVRPLIVLGAEGAGRETVARMIRASGSSLRPFVVHRAASFDPNRWAADVSRAAGAALHVRRPEILPQEEARSFWAATAFLPSCSARSMEKVATREHRLVVPQLIDRSADVHPIAEFVLRQVDSQLGRRRSSLRAEVRSMLLTSRMPENVRSLRAAVIRGALRTKSGELRAEHLDVLEGSVAGPGFRTRLREAERREIEAALIQNGWNVTEAARSMQLPRRTLVYRMARLGLTRP